jgi:glycosyltransferase involved in cell wall biosynthesis
MRVEVAVNGRFEGRRVTGVERYASEILRCLGERVRVVRPRRRVGGFGGHLWEQAILPSMISKHEVLWSPANTGPLAVSNQVVTIHDLSVIEHPEWFTAPFRLWYSLLLPGLARRARLVLTVSEHSRRSILDRFKLEDHKAIVIPNGVNTKQFHACDPNPARQKYRLPEQYVLFVGSLDPRKNLTRLLQAWNELADFPKAELVIAGSKTNIFRSIPIDHSLRRCRFLGYVPDEDLPGLYAGAMCFVMPSLFEGFGLTVLEAMACGAPVVAARAGALPEVTKDAAMLVDPTSVSGIARAIQKLLLEDGLRTEYRQKGIERAHMFSWTQSAEQIWEAISNNV